MEKNNSPYCIRLQVMSIGYLVPEDAATIWRGPMVMSAIEQLLRDVNWTNLTF